MDEPCSALDPTSTRVIEETMSDIAREVTIVIVTHNMQQAQRVSEQCAFFLAAENEPGRIVETGPTKVIFENPTDPAPPTTCTGGSDERDPPWARTGRSPRCLGLAAVVVSAPPASARRDPARRRLDVEPGGHPPVASTTSPSSACRSTTRAVGSTAGRQLFIAHQVDFAVSELPFLSDELKRNTRPFAYLPIVAGGTSLMYNIVIGGHRVTNLHLDSATMTGIFTGGPSRSGTIRGWSASIPS